MINLFKTLNLDETATKNEIEEAYRKLRPYKQSGRIEDKIDIAYILLINDSFREKHVKSIMQENGTIKPQLSIQKSTQSNSNYDDYMMKLKKLEEYIKKVKQQISTLMQKIDNKYANEYTSKLNTLKEETKQELTKLNNQRRNAIEHSWKIFNAKQKINAKYNELEEKIRLRFARKIAEYKSMYKGKLLVEYLANLPTQLKIEELLSVGKILENERANLLQAAPSNTDNYDQPKAL